MGIGLSVTLKLENLINFNTQVAVGLSLVVRACAAAAKAGDHVC